jgi:hypothetical protein
MKNPSSGSDLFYTDGRTDGRTYLTKLIVAFNNFVNASKNVPRPSALMD